MLVKHLDAVVVHLAEGYGGKPCPLSGEVNTADTREEAKVGQHFSPQYPLNLPAGPHSSHHQPQYDPAAEVHTLRGKVIPQRGQ